MHVEDEVVGAAVKVGDAGEDGGGATGYEGRGAGIAVALMIKSIGHIQIRVGGEREGSVPGRRII